MLADTRATSICGTSEYLAPEVFQGNGYSFSCDWWSFGCLLYEMLSGQPPFYFPNKTELFHAIQYSQPKFQQCFSEHARDLIKKLLKKDPAKRLVSPQEIKKHPFFCGINFDQMLLKNVGPPYIPVLSSSFDLGHFELDIVNMAFSSPQGLSDLGAHCDDEDYDGFTFEEHHTLNKPCEI
eukprot:CAMPEP_0170544820 /NCGR_PEP_ID=MMETSP0211-20121228/3440_1 /TAXON_ID=311385 /ORGANISM="Pseudokeronopsis sp., Strain OXSARD2" /LENGTH=179 /DNA_ID=CAMNT_0010848565 /DNA_START=922 /DNA_END=1461 /DNA_ORIENTATION=-